MVTSILAGFTLANHQIPPSFNPGRYFRFSMTLRIQAHSFYVSVTKLISILTFAFSRLTSICTMWLKDTLLCPSHSTLPTVSKQRVTHSIKQYWYGPRVSILPQQIPILLLPMKTGLIINVYKLNCLIKIMLLIRVQASRLWLHTHPGRYRNVCEFALN